MHRILLQGLAVLIRSLLVLIVPRYERPRAKRRRASERTADARSDGDRTRDGTATDGGTLPAPPPLSAPPPPVSGRGAIGDARTPLLPGRHEAADITS